MSGTELLASNHEVLRGSGEKCDCMRNRRKCFGQKFSGNETHRHSFLRNTLSWGGVMWLHGCICLCVCAVCTCMCKWLLWPNFFPALVLGRKWVFFTKTHIDLAFSSCVESHLELRLHFTSLITCSPQLEESLTQQVTIDLNSTSWNFGGFPFSAFSAKKNQNRVEKGKRMKQHLLLCLLFCHA